MQAKAAESQ